MRLTPLTESCNTNTCPQVYSTDRGTVVVQGSLLDAAALGVPTAAGEALVEIPGELLQAAATASLNAKG
jgi:hypothetical protein